MNMLLPKTLGIILLCLFCIKIQAQTQQKDSVYSYKNGSYDGIGKWYQGREIAYVMGFQGIGWLERPEREKEENVSR